MGSRVNFPDIFGSIICRRRRSSLLLELVCMVVALQTMTIFAPANFVCGAPMSIDEIITAATDSSIKGAASSRIAMSSAQTDVIKVELDMLFRWEHWQAMRGDRRKSSRRYRRNALWDDTSRWPNAEIPYQLNPFFDSKDVAAFNASLDHYHRYTCIRFRPAVETDRAFVSIISDNGCYSNVGLVNDSHQQVLSLGLGCREKNIIVHELGHALGLLHEQSRPDRDEYVIIRNESILPDMLLNFEKYSSDDVDTRSVPYDYLSVMHYGEKFMSKDRQKLKTIETKDPQYQSRIGNAPGLSFRDVKLINSIYSCSEKLKCGRKMCPGEGFVGTDCRCWCPSGNENIPAAVCSGCLDYHKYCQEFKQRGLCTKRLFRSYMEGICPRSCGRCT